jgi:DNA-directed RNA polymerase subunit RPC12/RpoP
MVNNADDVIGVCSECKSDQPMSAMYNSVFAQNGSAPVCRYCGGVVIITYRETRDNSLDQSDRDRGIN